MLGIEAIGWAAGSMVLDNVEHGRQWGRDEAFVREKIGFTSLRRLGQGQSALSLAMEAFHHLCAQAEVQAGQCDCLVVVTQNPDEGYGLPHMAARLHDKLHLSSSVAAFDLGLGCSGYVYALHVMLAFMEAAGLRQGLLFTADPYSPLLAPEDANTGLLFGDAATCTLISHTPRYVPGRGCFSTNGARSKALHIDAGGMLSMQGREIFNFGMLCVPPQLEQCMALNGLTGADISCLLLHQASRFIVKSIGERLGFPPEKTPFLLEDIGNCVSSTVPLALARLWENNYTNLLVSGFGVGLSWAATVLFQHEVQP